MKLSAEDLRIHRPRQICNPGLVPCNRTCHTEAGKLDILPDLSEKRPGYDLKARVGSTWKSCLRNRHVWSRCGFEEPQGGFRSPDVTCQNDFFLHLKSLKAIFSIHFDGLIPHDL